MALAIADRLADHHRDQQAGDPAACALHAGELERRLYEMDPDQRNLSRLHALGHELHALATQADAMFDRLEEQVEGTVERVRSTSARIGRLRGFAPYIAQLWSSIEEPLVLYEQPPQPLAAACSRLQRCLLRLRPWQGRKSIR